MQDNDGYTSVYKPCGCRAYLGTTLHAPCIPIPQTQAAQEVKQIPPTRNRREGETGYCLRLDGTLTAEVRHVAERKGISKRALIEEALRLYLQDDAAARVDTQLAPLINRVLHDQHQLLGKGLRTLIVRVGHEIIRTQFVLLNFMSTAGIPTSKVDTWREDGWRYAVKEFKVKPPDEASEPASPGDP